MIEVAHVLRKLERAAWGGVETHVAELAARLPAHGLESRVYAPGSRQQDERFGGAAVERYLAHCPYVGRASARRELVSSGGNLVSLELPWRLMQRPAAVVHAHTGRRIGGAALLAARRTGAPFVVSVHGPLLADAVVAEVEARRRSRGAVDVGQAFGWLVGARSVIERADRVICFNDGEHRALSERIGRRAVRLDHGVDAARLGAGSAERARRRWPGLGDGPIVVVLGRLCQQKNQRLAVRAFAQGAPGDARLVLAGAETDEGYRASVLDEARRLGVAERVWLAGNLSAADEVPDLLAAASVVLVPSTHEAFGIVVVEAWAAGAPALFARTTGTADLGAALGVPEAVVEGSEAGAWAAALGRLLADPALGARMREAGRRLVERRFGWDRAAEAHAALYRAVIAERAAAGRGRQERRGSEVSA